MKNTYLTEFIEIGGERWELLHLHKRKELVRKYAWAIPDKKTIQSIVIHAPKIIEIGAGTGYWAKLLADSGADIIAYDKYPREHIWFDVKFGDESKAADFPDRALMLCWPPYASPMAYNCLKQYKGDALIYVGEGQNGCTGDMKFHEELKYNWKTIKIHSIPKWFGIHDNLHICERL